MGRFLGGFAYGLAACSLCTWFVHQQLDNMDGKQARKTGNCSSLGSLFDHGCDVVNLFLTSTTILEITGMNGGEFYHLTGALIISFYFPVVEQCYN